MGTRAAQMILCLRVPLSTRVVFFFFFKLMKGKGSFLKYLFRNLWFKWTPLVTVRIGLAKKLVWS